MPMRKQEEFLANAQECERNAAKSTNLEERATWLEMAADWFRRVGRIKRDGADNAPASNEKADERS
jgi:hypothetical protein